MSLSWSDCRVNCKSRLSALARNWYLRGGQWREKCEQWKSEQQRLEETNRKLAAALEEEKKKHQQAQERIARLEQEIQTLQESTPQVQLPDDPPLPYHQYGPRLMTLCVNLVRAVGFRGSVRALKQMREWLGVDFDIPTWQTIRDWMRRHGLAMCQQARKASGHIWIVDHSNQIGTERLLLVLRTRKSCWNGKPLRHQDLEVIGLIPKDRWNAEEVGKVYCQLAKRYGPPRCILVDGATELREGAKKLRKKGRKVLVRRDLKHYLANQLEALLGKDPRFQSFMKQTGNTHAAIQQTELSHLTPQRAKSKARFMNIQPTLRWAEMILWQLDHPEADGRQGISEKRMEEKLGWLREYREDLQQWLACQKIVELGVQFANTQGIYRGAAREFKKQVAPYAQQPLSRQLMERTVEFLKGQAKGLQPGERLPLSTEIIESCFGCYKQLEGQHSKGGFTTLLPAFGALLRKATPASLAGSLRRVTNKDVREWTKQHLGRTLASRRQGAYREHRKATRLPTQKRATEVLCLT